MGVTPIEYVDRSINPIRARLLEKPPEMKARGEGHYCEKVSPGCKNCYSSKTQPRFGMPPFNEARGDDNVEVFFDHDALIECTLRKIPTRWFPFDMTDAWGWWVRDEWLDYFFGVAAQTPQHTYLFPTKRAARMRRYSLAMYALSPKDRARRLAGRWGVGALDENVGYLEWPLPNVHLGISVEDQNTFEDRWADLEHTPAAVRWISYEPALEGVDFTRALPHRTGGCGHVSVDWIVVGGESGGSARPFDLAWARSTVEQCRAAGVPVFVKQLGSKPIAGRMPHPDDLFVRLRDRKGGDMTEWPEDLRVREFPHQSVRFPHDHGADDVPRMVTGKAHPHPPAPDARSGSEGR